MSDPKQEQAKQTCNNAVDFELLSHGNEPWIIELRSAVGTVLGALAEAEKQARQYAEDAQVLRLKLLEAETRGTKLREVAKSLRVAVTFGPVENLNEGCNPGHRARVPLQFITDLDAALDAVKEKPEPAHDWSCSPACRCNFRKPASHEEKP